MTPRFLVSINSVTDWLWLDVRAFGHVLGFCWAKRDYRRTYFYHRKVNREGTAP